LLLLAAVAVIIEGMTAATDLPAFALGSTAVRRDVFRGKVWTATPTRVILDAPGELVLCHWPGTPMAGTDDLDSMARDWRRGRS
jgi:hypothetical protein